MILQTNPNAWSCLPTAFAIALDVPVAEFIERIGHDGSEPVFGNGKPWRGFHIQECLLAATTYGAYGTLYEFQPQSTQDGRNIFIFDFKIKVDDMMAKSNGVLLGFGRRDFHAVAWECDSKIIYDPKGFTYHLPTAYFTPKGFAPLKMI